MTPFVWRQRLSKKTTATLMFLAMLATVFFYRHLIVIKSIEHFTKPHDVNISCLNFSFDWRLHINIQQACIISPIGTMRVSQAIWQPWPSVLSIEKIKVNHVTHRPTDNNIEDGSSQKQPTNKLNLADYLPLPVRLSISNLEIDSFSLLQPLHLGVSTVSNNELSITGDVNAAIKLSPHSVGANVQWRLSNLTKWIPQAQQLSQDYTQLFKNIALDESNIKTSLTFDGKTFIADTHLDTSSSIDASNCPIDAIIKGGLLVNVDMSSLNISLDLSALSSSVSLVNCPLLQEYFAEDDLPQLSFIFAQTITIDKTHLNVPELHIIDKQNSQRSIILSALNDSTTGEFNLKGTINSSGIQMGTTKFANMSSDFFVSGTNINDLQLSVDNQFYQWHHPDASMQNITNHMDVNIKQLTQLSFSGTSTVSNSFVQNIHFTPINIAHTGQASLANMTLSSRHEIRLEHDFLVALEQQQTKAKVRINQQDMLSLQSIISQFDSTLFVKAGKLSASIELTLPQEGALFIAQAKADFQGVSIKYQDYLLNNMTYQTPLTFDSAGLQLPASTLHIDSVDVGVTIAQLEANVIAKDSVIRLTQVQGEIFNGHFSLAELWLDEREQQFNINIQSIDLAQVVALQQQPGIQIIGSIDGELPFMMGKQGVSIENGWVSSLTGGKLTIIDNPSFDSIKVQQPDLALLENIDFTQLESNVKLDPDGWVFFDFSIKGNNPDANQGVNFNYSHQENIFPLLESIRLVKSIENTIEQKITQGEKK